jgi:late competence protein required for DNA uptake (superfamily II DNA/RNA helicase)
VCDDEETEGSIMADKGTIMKIEFDGDFYCAKCGKDFKNEEQKYISWPIGLIVYCEACAMTKKLESAK